MSQVDECFLCGGPVSYSWGNEWWRCLDEMCLMYEYGNRPPTLLPSERQRFDDFLRDVVTLTRLSDYVIQEEP